MFQFFKKKKGISDELSQAIIFTSLKINSDFIDACETKNVSHSIDELMNLFLETNVFLLYVVDMIVERKIVGDEKVTLINEISTKLIDFIITTEAFKDSKTTAEEKLAIFSHHFKTNFYSHSIDADLFHSTTENPALLEVFEIGILENHLSGLDEETTEELAESIIVSVVKSVNLFVQNKLLHEFLE